MIAYLSPSEYLTAVMSGAAAATNPTYNALWQDVDGSPNQSVGSLNGTTAVNLVSGASTGGQRVVERASVYNADSAAVVVTIAKVASSGTSYTLGVITLAAADTLHCLADGSFRVIDSSGQARIIRTGYTTQMTKAHAKVGATSGWVLPTTTDLPYMATMAASQTGGTLVVHLDGLHIGDTITGYKVVAQVESAGNTVTIDAALRAVTNVAAEPTDAAIGTGMTQVSVTADTAVASSKSGHAAVVTSGLTYYLLLTATTGASCDIILQNIELVVTTA